MSGCPDAEEEACVSKEREMVRHEKDYYAFCLTCLKACR